MLMRRKIQESSLIAIKIGERALTSKRIKLEEIERRLMK
jgi:hypothetical protein